MPRCQSPLAAIDQKISFYCTLSQLVRLSLSHSVCACVYLYLKLCIYVCVLLSVSVAAVA